MEYPVAPPRYPQQRLAGGRRGETAMTTTIETEPAGLTACFQAHWREYLMEACCLGVFMVAACVFGVLLEHPAAPLHQAMESAFARRLVMGVAMGATAIGLIRSPFGQRSGAHMNPAVTLAYFTLGKVQLWDAVFYVVFQFFGAVAGVLVAGFIIGIPLRHSSVNYVETLPGHGGPVPAFLAEVLISLLLMSIVLLVSNSKLYSRWTPFVAGALVAVYITFEAPVSGMSMNPARTFGSAFCSHNWSFLWIYFTAPPLGMLLAAQLYRLRGGVHRVYCAKLHHHNNQRCIFRCNYGELHVNE